jgi:hypothetical protein
MAYALEFHGRLCRADHPPARPGLYDLRFGLHARPDDHATLWEDEIDAIPVAAGGFYHVVLGRGNALEADVFDGSPRFLSVRLARLPGPAEEVADRVPLLGLVLRLADALVHVEARIAALEAAPVSSRDPTARLRTRQLRRRLSAISGVDGSLAALADRLTTIEARIARLDGERGRVVRMEDELEDLVGPDGDVVDLDARLCRLEGVTPPGAPDRLAVLERRFGELEGRLKRR